MKWQISPRLSPDLLEHLRLQRGLSDQAAFDQFLSPDLRSLAKPSLLPGACQAADRIYKAIQDKQQIAIYGDYDVDGLTGTSILALALAELGSTPLIYIPNRLEEGYGLNKVAAQHLIDTGVQLTVTVDCGITAVDEVALFRGTGCDIIVTDHHHPADTLPDCLIVHPTAQAKAPNTQMCGSLVAWQVAWQLFLTASRPSDTCLPKYGRKLLELLPLAALGTIADCVPLIGENRMIVYHGLQQLVPSKVSLPGLRAFIDASGLSKIDSGDVGFRLAPRINAAGRMGHSGMVVSMFTASDYFKALTVAETLEKANSDRQKIERKMVKEAIAQHRAASGVDHNVIIVKDKTWHHGVIGIVASRLVDEFHLPALVFVNDGASGRSIEGLSLIDCLTECKDTLTRFGGHDAAAGLHVAEGKYDSFVKEMDAAVGKRLTPEMRERSIKIAAETTIDEIDDLDLVERLHRFGPFGQGNKRPLFLFRNVTVSTPRRIGNEGQYLSFVANQGRNGIKAVWFSVKEPQLSTIKDGMKAAMAGYIQINRFNGEETVQIEVAYLAGEEEIEGLFSLNWTCL